MNSIEVLFSGNSVYLCGMAAGLEGVKPLRIRRVENVLDKAFPEVKMLHPDVVIFEAVHNYSKLVGSLMREYPKLLIIVIRPETDSLEIFSRGKCTRSPVDDLTRIIKQWGQYFLSK